MPTRTNTAKAEARGRRPTAARSAVSKATTLDDAITAIITKYRPAGTRRARSIARTLRTAADTLWAVKLGYVGGLVDTNKRPDRAFVRPYAITDAPTVGTRGHSEPLTVGDITRDEVRKCVPHWLTREGLTAPDVNMVLHLLSTLGIDCQDLWARRATPSLPPNPWLSPDSFNALLKWLRTECVLPCEAVLVADLIEWVALTGLPIDETLRLQWKDIRQGLPREVGTDARSPNLSLGLMPAIILQRRRVAEPPGPDEQRVFPISYRSQCAHWELCRMFLGVTGNRVTSLEGLWHVASEHLVTMGLPLTLAHAHLQQPRPVLAIGHPYLVGDVVARAVC